MDKPRTAQRGQTARRGHRRWVGDFAIILARYTARWDSITHIARHVRVRQILATISFMKMFERVSSCTTCCSMDERFSPSGIVVLAHSNGRACIQMIACVCFIFLYNVWCVSLSGHLSRLSRRYIETTNRLLVDFQMPPAASILNLKLYFEVT
jgi:hypothetical protein